MLSVNPADIQKMLRMQLGDLPLSSIALPVESPQLLTHDPVVNDIARHLSDYFPGYLVAALYELQSLFVRLGVEAYLIGGLPRDLLLLRERQLDIVDVDITLVGDASEVVPVLLESSRNFHRLEDHPTFGTAKLIYKDRLVMDFASTRREVYTHCGALPQVVARGVPLAEDVCRRDFTMNALALSIHQLGQVLDHTQGVQDLRSGTMRVLTPVSFFEDPSRILRGLKFAERLGFRLSGGTTRLIRQFLRHGQAVYRGGGDRIRTELLAFLSEIDRADSPILHAFLDLGIIRLANMQLSANTVNATLLGQGLQRLPTILKGLGSVAEGVQEEVHLCLLFSEVPPEVWQETASRLNLTRQQRHAVEVFHRWHQTPTSPMDRLSEAPSATMMYDTFHEVPLASIIAALIAYGMNHTDAQFQRLLEGLNRYQTDWQHVHVDLSGKDLLELGVPPGKLVGVALRELLFAKLSGKVHDRLEEIQFVREWLNA